MSKSQLTLLCLILILGNGILPKTTCAGDNTQWMQTYGGSAQDKVYTVIQTMDGGFALAGSTMSYGAGRNDAWLVKVDFHGEVQWIQTYGATKDDFVISIIQTRDGGFALAGWTYSFGVGSSDGWLIKTDSQGVSQWQQVYGGSAVDWFISIIQMADNGFALAGTTSSYGTGEEAFWLVKTDVKGEVQWMGTYDVSAAVYPGSCIQTSDGGFALAGSTSSDGTRNFDTWDACLVKIDTHGELQWIQTYGGSSLDGTSSIIQTIDGGFVLAGKTASYGAGSYDAWLVKVDTEGIREWEQIYGGSSQDQAESVISTVDGGFAFVGTTSSFGAGDRDFWLVKTDASGVGLWNQTYGGSGRDEIWGKGIIQIADGGFVLAGGTASYGAGSYDAWLVKTDAQGAVTRINRAAFNWIILWVIVIMGFLTLTIPRRGKTQK